MDRQTPATGGKIIYKPTHQSAHNFEIMSKNLRFNLVCKNCGKDFLSNQAKTKYCSVSCRSEAQRKDGWRTNPLRQYGLSCGKMGAYQELRVCMDLMLKGYEVFRAVSPSCSCDLIALKNGKCSRVEVKTGYINKAGELYPKTSMENCDIFASATPDRIIYLFKGSDGKEVP